MVQIGQIAPNFVQNSTDGLIEFHNWLEDSWCVLFSHPKNFTPVCTTELGEVARLKDEWGKRGVKVLGLSVDSLENHPIWAEDIAQTQGQTVNFPLLADDDRSVSALYGMVHPDSDPLLTVRAVFVIDPKKKVRLTLNYPPSAGRNFVEILRIVDSLQLTDREKVSTPVNWKLGEKVIVSPMVSDDEAASRFPQGIEKQKDYLRYVKL
ncbi:peroxiredoxin [Rhizobium sp. Leaf262]|uniref:peroxiredoxin n=1 Tax=Rhizobium sp. Leaf262 TaxID=1736312 RepID=UPI00071610F0|nr:peroxiredoxin [Rhizobium sp. Leaf262]KQO75919.1 peroxidase [Rhizobium sp. Leaf262]